MLPIPLVVQGHVHEPEVRREVHDEPRPGLQKIPYYPRALHVWVSHKRHVQSRSIYLARLDELVLQFEVRVDLANRPPGVTARGNAHAPHLRMPRKQAHQLRPRVPAAAVDARIHSHAPYYTPPVEYLCKFLHKTVDPHTRGCDNKARW